MPKNIFISEQDGVRHLIYFKEKRRSIMFHKC